MEPQNGNLEDEFLGWFSGSMFIFQGYNHSNLRSVFSTKTIKTQSLVWHFQGEVYIPFFYQDPFLFLPTPQRTSPNFFCPRRDLQISRQASWAGSGCQGFQPLDQGFVQIGCLPNRPGSLPVWEKNNLKPPCIGKRHWNISSTWFWFCNFFRIDVFFFSVMFLILWILFYCFRYNGDSY